MSEPLLRRASPSDTLSEALALLAEDNVDFCERVLASEPATTADGLASVGVSHAALAKWEQQNAIFSFSHRGQRWFFSFQFEDEKPRPVMSTVLAALPTHFSPLQRAAWFVSTNGWLDGDAPRDRLDDMVAIVGAATHEAEDLIG